MSVALDWAQFAACALVIGYAGARLTRLAHAIGEKTGLSGSWIGLLLLGVVGASLLLERLALLPTIGPVGFYTPLLLLLYLVAMRSVYDYERRQPAPSGSAVPPRYRALSLRRVAWQFILFAMVVVISLDDLVYTGGAILANVAPVHAVTAFSAAMMSGAVIIGVLYRPKRRWLYVPGAVSLALAAVYLVNVDVLYVHGE